MDFGKSLISSVIFDIALPLVSGIVQATTGPHGEVISKFINGATPAIKDTVNAALEGTSFKDAAPKIFNDHMGEIIDSITHVTKHYNDLNHDEKVLKATDHFGQQLMKKAA